MMALMCNSVTVLTSKNRNNLVCVWSQTEVMINLCRLCKRST